MIYFPYQLCCLRDEEKRDVNFCLRLFFVFRRPYHNKEDRYDERKNKKTYPRFWLCLSLLICLISCIGASLVQTNFGNVTIKDLRFETESGHQMSALLLVPDTATPENPAPAIIWQPRLVQQQGNAGPQLCRIRPPRIRCALH